MRRFLNFIPAIVFASSLAAGAVEAASPENTLIMETNKGRVVIEMLPDVAPNHVERIKELVRQQFYDGIVFHRVIEGFMAQTGDPLGKGTGGSGKNIKAEFNAVPFDRGVVGMARANHPDSADSQFFIMFEDGHFLNNNYTVWGRVVEGMDKIDSLKMGAQGSGTVSGERDNIVTMRVQSDQ